MQSVATSGGWVEYFGETIQVLASDTTNSLAGKIAAALTTSGGYVSNDGTTAVTWSVTANNNVLTFAYASKTGTGDPAWSGHQPLLSTAAHTFKAVTNRPAADTDVAELTDDSVPDWSVDPQFAANGINASGNTPGNTSLDFSATNGKDAVGEQIGNTGIVRETTGDGDYLDFSAWDVFKVVVNGATVAETTDLAGAGKYVSITGGTDGVYNFSIVDGSSTTLVGVVDFGAPVTFDDSNFILFNDIIV